MVFQHGNTKKAGIHVARQSQDQQFGQFERKRKRNGEDEDEDEENARGQDYLNSNAHRNFRTFAHNEQNGILDRDGLRRAYRETNGLFKQGKALYVAGTRLNQAFSNPDNFFQDLMDDVKLPFFQTHHAERYKFAKEFLDANPDVDEIVGHSLGGSVILQLQKDYAREGRQIHSTTYAAPVVTLPGFSDPNAENNRFRNDGDYISMFDKHAYTAPAPDLSNDEFYQAMQKAAPYYDLAAYLYGDQVPEFLSLVKKVNPFRVAGQVQKLKRAHDYKNFSKQFGQDITLHENPTERVMHEQPAQRNYKERQSARMTHDTEYQARHVH